MGKWGRRHIHANLLASLIEGKVCLSADYSTCQILKDVQVEMGIKISYIQCWRAQHYVTILEMGRSEDIISFFLGCVLQL